MLSSASHGPNLSLAGDIRRFALSSHHRGASEHAVMCGVLSWNDDHVLCGGEARRSLHGGFVDFGRDLLFVRNEDGFFAFSGGFFCLVRLNDLYSTA